MGAPILIPQAFRQHRRAPYYHPAYRVPVTRAVDHEAAERILGTSLECKGIHLPPDPPVGSLKGSAAKFWASVYHHANEYYDDKTISAKTAWKTLRVFYRKAWRGWQADPALPIRRRGPRQFIQNPGELAQLGTCIELTYVDCGLGQGNVRFPELQIIRFDKRDAPYLYWSDLTKSCYVFPKTEPGPCKLPDLGSKSAEDFERFTQRKARCLRDVDVPEVYMGYDGMFDTVVYASDKWHDPNPNDKMVGSQEYIHQVGDGVSIWAEQATDPQAIMFLGGCLDMEERGLIH